MNRRRLAAGILSFGFLVAAVLLGQSPAAASHISNITYGSGIYVAANHYEHENYGGSVLTHKVPSTCDGSLSDEYTDPGWLPGNWDNDIDSFIGASSCWVKIYEEPWFAGANLGYVSSDNEVGGAMHDRTSSIKWS